MPIILSSIHQGDEQTLFEWINDRDLVVESSGFAPVHWASHQEWLEHVANNPSMRIFTIRHSMTGELIGTCQLHSINLLSRNAELQIRIGRSDQRGKGIGKEAVTDLVRFGFEDLNLHRIYLHRLAKNLAARRCYEHVGFLEEGLLRDAVFIDGAFSDIALMGLLQNEWATSRHKRSK